MKRLILLFSCMLAGPAAAQVTATLPVTCNAAGTICTQATPVSNPDGTAIGSNGTGTRTTAAGTSDTQAVPVQGVTNGVPQRVSQVGSSTLATTQVSVLTTATLVSVARTGRSRLVITQSAAGPCYYGPANTVSATTGARLIVAGASKAYQFAGALYGICPGGAVTTDVDEEY